MAESATIKAILTLKVDQFTTALERANRKLSAFGSRMTRTGRDLTFALTVPLAAAGKEIIKVGTEFDLVQRKIGALGGTGKIKELSNSARELGATTVFTASQVGELQLNLRRLGQSNKEIQQLQGTILKFAQAMDQDLGEAGLFVVQTMNRYNQELSLVGDTQEQVQYVTNLFAKATAESALDVDKLRNALNYAGSELAQYGISLRDSVSLLAVLANNGFEASRGGTALRRVISELAKEGFTGDQAINRLLTSQGKYADQLEEFGLRGAGSASALAGMREEFDDLNRALDVSSGFLDRYQELIDESLFAKFRKLASAAQELALSFSETLEPAVAGVVDEFADFIRGLAEMPQSMKNVISVIGTFLAALGPVSLILGGIATAVSGLIGGFGKFFNLLSSKGPIANLASLAAKNPALALLSATVAGLATVYFEVTDVLDKGQSVVDNYHAKVRALLETEKKRAELGYGGVMGLSGDAEQDVPRLQAALATETEKLNRALLGSDRDEKFIENTQAEIDTILRQLEKILVDDPAKKRLDDLLDRIQKQADEAKKRQKKIEDGEIISLNNLIKRHQDLLRTREQLTGQSKTLEKQGILPVDLPELDELDKKIADTVGSIKDLLSGRELTPIPVAATQENFDLLNETIKGTKAEASLLGEGVEPVLQLRTAADGTTAAFTSLFETFQFTKAELQSLIQPAAQLTQIGFAIGNVFGDAFLAAAEGTASFADALRDNLINALNQIARKLITLTILYGVLTILSGGTGQIAAAADFARGNSFGEFLGSGFGAGSLRSSGGGGLKVQGVLAGSDISLSAKRGVTANDRIYG